MIHKLAARYYFQSYLPDLGWRRFFQLTYIQVGFVLHIVISDRHLLSFQENLSRQGTVHIQNLTENISVMSE